MDRGFHVDLSKLADRLPGRVQRGLKMTGKALGKPLAVADAVVNPIATGSEAAMDAMTNPIATGRLRRCTIECRAHVVGLADVPAKSYASGPDLTVVLLRLRVERPNGDVETCVRQHIPSEIRRIVDPQSSLRALAHEDDPRIAVIDWKATGERLGAQLSWPATADQFAWPDPAEWPAVGAIEIRDLGRYERRLRERRATWTPAVARLAGASQRGGRVDGREKWDVTLDLPWGNRMVVNERVPSLALARLIGFRQGAVRFGGVVTKVELVTRLGAPIAVLASPAGEVAIDWEATLRAPELRTPPAL